MIVKKIKKKFLSIAESLFNKDNGVLATEGAKPTIVYENYLRSVSYQLYEKCGYDIATQFLPDENDHLGDKWCTEFSQQENPIKTCQIGILNEIACYHHLKSRYHIHPTLDNGFGFDFLGYDEHGMLAIDAKKGDNYRESNATGMKHEIRFMYCEGNKSHIELCSMGGDSPLWKDTFQNPNETAVESNLKETDISSICQNGVVSALRNRLMYWVRKKSISGNQDEQIKKSANKLLQYLKDETWLTINECKRLRCELQFYFSSFKNSNADSCFPMLSSYGGHPYLWYHDDKEGWIMVVCIPNYCEFVEKYSKQDHRWYIYDGKERASINKFRGKHEKIKEEEFQKLIDSEDEILR